MEFRQAQVSSSRITQETLANFFSNMAIPEVVARNGRAHVWFLNLTPRANGFGYMTEKERLTTPSHIPTATRRPG